MPTRNEVNTTITALITASGSDKVTAAEHRAANTAMLDYTDQEVARVEAEKQDALVSGTNIKTVNGTPLLGAGDITISGGGSITTDATPTASSPNPVQSGGVFTALAARDAAIAGKASATHPHAISDVSGLQAALDALEGLSAADLLALLSNTGNIRFTQFGDGVEANLNFNFVVENFTDIPDVDGGLIVKKRLYDNFPTKGFTIGELNALKARMDAVEAALDLDPPPDPADSIDTIPGGLFWLSPEDVVMSGGGVLTLTDKFGNGNDFTKMASSPVVPLIPSDATANGQTVLHFDGMATYGLSGNVTVTGGSVPGLTIFKVIKTAGTSLAFPLEKSADASVSTTGFHLITNHPATGQMLARTYGNAGESTGGIAVPNTAWGVICIEIDKSLTAEEVKMYLNDVTPGAIRTSDVDNTDNGFDSGMWYLGCRANYDLYFAGWMGDIIAFERADLSDAEKQIVYDNLKPKFGIA